MKPNEIMPAAFDNIPQPGVAGAAMADQFDMCTYQFYNPQPIVGAKLTYAYVPFQCLYCLYTPEMGLKQGTIFPELDRPYGADPVYSYDG